MKIALTQACLKVKCYFCFSIVADNVILVTATSETEFRRKLFARPAFSRKSGQYCGSTMRAVLHNTSENGEWESAYGAHPEPYFGKEDMGSRAVDSPIDLTFWHCLGAVDISVAQKGYYISIYCDDAVYYKPSARIGKDDGVLLEILLAYWSQGYG